MDTIFRTHGIREFTTTSTDLDQYAEEIRNIGYCVVPDLIPERELETARLKIDAVYQRQARELGGEDKLELINDAKVARCLISYDDYFLSFATQPVVAQIMKNLMGEYYILMSQNAIINAPDGIHYQITWHRDLNYQHFVSSRPVAISVLYCIDEFSEATGGTHVLPHSHRAEAFPSREYVQKHQRVVEARAGSAIVFDAMLFHRGGQNTSGRMRRAINHIFTLPLIKQQISLPRALKGRLSDSEALRRLLGYESEPGESTLQWREIKLARANAPGH